MPGTVTIPKNLGHGAAYLNRKLRQGLEAIATDLLLEHAKVTAVTGDSADTDIALTGITTDDVVLTAVAIFYTTDATPVFASVDMAETDEISITEAGVIQITFDTTNAEVFVFWVDKSTRNIQMA